MKDAPGRGASAAGFSGRGPQSLVQGPISRKTVCPRLGVSCKAGDDSSMIISTLFLTWRPPLI